MTVRHLFPDVAPTLNLDFANTKRLDPRITFTRASTGTYVDEFGIVRTAASNGARFDHDSDRNSLGLLVEESRTNLQTYSEDFSQWTITVSNNTPGASVSTNFATAPDGTTTADKFIPVNESFNYIRRGTINASNWSLTVYMKAAGMDYASIAVGTSGSVRFNLANGTVVTETNATGQIQALANGWYRCTLIKTGFASTQQFRIFPGDNSSSSQITTADGVKGILIWGAQAEDATFATSYIPTTSSTATRSADVASMTGTNFSSWYNQSEGTMQMIFNANPLNTNTQFLGVGTTSSTVAGYVYRASTLYAVQANGANNWSNTSSWLTTGITVGNNRFVFGYSPGSNATVRNGLIQETNTETVIVQQTSTTLYIAKELTGTIARLNYYDRRLTDAQLQALTL